MLKFLGQRFFTKNQIANQVAVDLFNTLRSKIFFLENKGQPINNLEEEYFTDIFQILAAQEKSYLIRGLATLARLKNSSVVLRKYENEIVDSINSVDKNFVIFFLRCYSTIPDQNQDFLLELTKKIEEILPKFSSVELYKIYCAYIKSKIISLDFLSLLKGKIIENMEDATHDELMEIVDKFNLHKDEKIIMRTLSIIETRKDIFTYIEKIHILNQFYIFHNIYSNILIMDLYENAHKMESLAFSKLCLYVNKTQKSKTIFGNKLEDILVNMDFDMFSIETVANIIESFKSTKQGKFVCEKLLNKVTNLINDFTPFQCSIISFCYGINNSGNEDFWKKIAFRALRDKGKIKKGDSILMIYGIFMGKKLDKMMYNEFSCEWTVGELNVKDIPKCIEMSAAMGDKKTLMELKDRMNDNYKFMNPIVIKKCEKTLSKFKII
ncbi:hypothetical protein SteCoe_30716 [Stentor coeruleus]|uniref:Uncharacterized protein n=1 Tax=Stentor coeruleus TaxID=5963 RepID=A0A1R2B3E7_9CILI|nr:hypothetical protein SteCoe_30716 [Stentor coeruleus]